MKERRKALKTSRTTTIIKPTRSSLFLVRTIASIPDLSIAPFSARTCSLRELYLCSYLNEIVLVKNINFSVVCGVFHE